MAAVRGEGAAGPKGVSHRVMYAGAVGCGIGPRDGGDQQQPQTSSECRNPANGAPYKRLPDSDFGPTT